MHCAECGGATRVRYNVVMMSPLRAGAPPSDEPVPVAFKERPCGMCRPVEFARWRAEERRRLSQMMETGQLAPRASVDDYLPR